MTLRVGWSLVRRRGHVETVPFCADRCDCPGRCVQFAQDVLQMGGDSPRGHDEGASDFLVGAPFEGVTRGDRRRRAW